MESTCFDDQQSVAVVYCACRFPLVPLCQTHAEKHLSDSHGFHFTLPLAAYHVIPSEEVYMQWKPWLYQLNTNYELLRKKFQLLAEGEGQIDSAYQDLLHFASEAAKRFKHELSAKKEGFSLEIEKAIVETRNYALEVTHQPMSALSQLLWYYQPSQVVPYQLFTFQAKCIQEHLSSTFQIALNFAPGLEHLNMGKCVQPLTDQIEELTKQLTSKEETHSAEVQTLSQQLQDAKAQEERSNNELQQVIFKLQNAQGQLQDLQTNSLNLKNENETLKQQIKVQTTQLAQFRSLDETLQIKIQLEAQLREQRQTLEMDCKLKDEHCVSLDREKKALESQVDQLNRTVAELKGRNQVLEARLTSWGITTDPPSVSQEPVPDYSTPQSRAALAKFGPYSGQDEEHILTKRGPVVDETGVYIGQWNARNQYHGYGKYLWKCGDVYEGQWRNGQRNGRGRLIFANGAVYVGDFVQGKKEGFGTNYFIDGNEYSGTWVNDKLHGVGSYKFGEASQGSGNRYIGDFLDHVKNGVGAHFWADGRMYVGQWKSDKMHGKGLMSWPDGQMYYGDSADDVRAGTGCYVWPNGNIYKGQWAQGKQNGRGELTHPGKVDAGVWVDSVLR